MRARIAARRCRDRTRARSACRPSAATRTPPSAWWTTSPRRWARGTRTPRRARRRRRSRAPPRTRRSSCAAPALELKRWEPELDLALRALRRVGAVDQVVLRLQGVVTPDRAGCGLLDGVGAARDLPPRRDGARALHDGREHRAGRDELQQALEERLAVVLGVVLAGQLAADRAQVHRDDVEP